MKDHTVEQYEFRCRLSYHIYAIQTILHQYLHTLNACKPDALLKVGAIYSDMAAQEKIIDGFIELIKRGQLDENIPTEALEKCVAYFNTMYPVLLGSEMKLNHSQMLSDSVKTLQYACDGINNGALVIRNLIEVIVRLAPKRTLETFSLLQDSTIGDVGLLCQHVIQTVDQLQQQLKLVKRRLPTDSTIANLGLNKEINESLYQCYQHAGKIWKTLHDVVKTAVQAINSSTGNFTTCNNGFVLKSMCF